jgi:hypothetical protein
MSSFHKEALLNKQDVANDIAAALSMCLAISLGVVRGHECCPYCRTAEKAVRGLEQLLARFVKEEPCNTSEK